MKFLGEKASFGRHESFPLRYGWITKGYHALLEDPSVFESEDATVKLGVGKNMVNAIRYWLQAARIVEKTSLGYQSTLVGYAVFRHGGFDPFLEDEATIWLIHWLLSSNPSIATATYWFFNHFYKPEFSGQEASTALLDFVKQNSTVRSSPTTIRQDVTVLLRMYVRTKGNTRTPLEDALDSPLSVLRLINQSPGGRIYRSRPEPREGIPLGIFAFAVSELLLQLRAQQLPIEDLMYTKGGYPAPGAVFRLTENALLTKLERLVRLLPHVYELRESAGIHQLYLLENIEPIDMLNLHYQTADDMVPA